MKKNEIIRALATPEPDYHDNREAWQPWNDRRLEALEEAKRRGLVDRLWVCPWCKTPYPDGDPFASNRKEREVIGCPNCGNFEQRRLDEEAVC